MVSGPKVSKFLEMLEYDEGRIPYAYPDSRGFLTIGVGCLIDKRKGGGLDDVEIDFLRDRRIAKKTAEVKKELPWFDWLNEARQAVILSMAFQLGTDGLMGFVNTLKAVEEARWKDAANGMRKSLWAQQTPGRVNRLANQMESGEWQPWA